MDYFGMTHYYFKSRFVKRMVPHWTVSSVILKRQKYNTVEPWFENLQ